MTRQEIIVVEHSTCGERVLSMCRESSHAKIHFLRDTKDETTSMSIGDIQGKVIMLRTCNTEIPKLNEPIMMSVAWTCDSRQVVTSQGISKPASSTDLYFDADAEIRVWCGYSGKLFRVLKRTTDPTHGSILRQAVWNVRTHPVDSRILMSAGDDGRVILWNIESGKSIWCWTNRHPGGQSLMQAKPGQAIAIADSIFSSDGTSFAVSDGNGRWSLFSTGSKNSYLLAMPEQYFMDDYSPLRYDSEEVAVDESGGRMPHLLPRTPLCNYTLVPYVCFSPQNMILLLYSNNNEHI
jgi:WD40 repeat protein